jgi:hypothetical protein
MLAKKALYLRGSNVVFLEKTPPYVSDIICVERCA